MNTEALKSIVKGCGGIAVTADCWDDFVGGWIPTKVELSVGPRGGLRALSEDGDVLKGLPRGMRERQIDELIKAILQTEGGAR